MSLEPFLAFFLIRYLRKTLRIFSPNLRWDKTLTMLLYGVVGLFIVEIIFHTHPVTQWVWSALFFYLIWICLKERDFSFARQVIYAVLPVVVLSLFSDLMKLIQVSAYKKIEGFIDLAFAAALTWMIALLVKSNRQQKALENERRKTKEQEERNKFVEGQKDQLEVLVNARTAELTKQKEELQHAIAELKSAQAQLIQSEKMASLGELTAGIAHEIQNPLNFVNNFSDVNAELIDELKEELSYGHKDEAIAIANSIRENEQKINHHGKRADAIVKGMLQHSRSSTGQKEPTDVNVLADEYLRLAYHGLRAKDKTFNATLKTDYDQNIQKVNVVPQEIGRVILNLITNAFYAVADKKKLLHDAYSPTVSVSTRQYADKVEIKVADNGNGIPQPLLGKIFQPFFTTKPTGEGTGLGLSLSYDIVKAHGGELQLKTTEGNGTEFLIELPVK